MSNLDELRERKAARAKAAADAAEALEVEELTLEETWTEKGLKVGLDFVVVRTDVGCFVVRRPEFVSAKQFNAIPGDKRTVEDAMRFVEPSIAHPSREAFRSLMQDYSGIAFRLTNAALALHSGQAVELSGKF